MIAQVCTSASWGGLEMVVPILARALARRGYRVSAICREGSPIEERLAREGIPRLTLRGGGYFSPRSVLAIRDFVRRDRTRLIHSHYSRDPWNLVPAIGWRREIGYVHTRHINSGVLKRDPLHSWLFRRVDGWIASSRDGRENLLRTHPVDPRKVHVVANGVDFSRSAIDPSARGRIRRELGIPEGAIVVGMLGRLSPAKGHRTLFRSAGKVMAQAGRKVLFLIVGGPSRGEEGFAESLRREVGAMGLDGEVVFAGHREDVREVLSAMDVYVMPSDKESFGISLLEAMGCGLPVVTTAVGGPREVVEDGKSGILVPPRDPDRLAGAIVRIIRDEGLRRRLGTAAREQVLHHYSEDAMVEGVLAVYRSVTRERGVDWVGRR